MAITSSAKKAIKRSRFLRGVNQVYRYDMKKAIKAVKKAIAEGVESKKMETLMKQAQCSIDKAARKNIIHKGNAARRKSRLSALISRSS